jgi:hypothetical protein
VSDDHDHPSDVATHPAIVTTLAMLVGVCSVIVCVVAVAALYASATSGVHDHVPLALGEYTSIITDIAAPNCPADCHDGLASHVPL